MQSKVIRFNLKDRGRQFRGAPRNFDIPRIVAAINSGVTQEKVRHRDMLGYFGHWPRIKFGMNPAEGGIVDGRAVAVEPAMVTVYLKAFDDGTVEHQAEFLDTAAGKIAARMYNSNTGGFSSAIDERRPEFYGFDYVMEPNFTHNRGYALALDGVTESDLTLDDVAADYNNQLVGVLGLLDSVQNQHASEIKQVHEALMNLEAINKRLQEENDQYISMLARGTTTLDSLESVMPFVIDKNETSRLQDDINSFRSAQLERIDPPKKKEDPNQSRLMQTVRRYAGLGL